MVDSNEPKAVVRRFLDALLAGDMATINSLLADDCVIRLPGKAPRTPWAGVWKGPEEIARCFTIIGETLEIQSHDIRKLIVEGEDAIVIGDEVSVSRTTGRTITQTYAWWFQISGGQIHLYHLFEDTEAIAAAYQ